MVPSQIFPPPVRESFCEIYFCDGTFKLSSVSKQSCLNYLRVIHGPRIMTYAVYYTQ